MKNAMVLTALSVGLTMLAGAPALADPVIGVIIKPTVVVAPVRQEPPRRVVIVERRHRPHWHGKHLHYGPHAPGQYRPRREVVIVEHDD